jgi:hypothetical protein
MKWKFSWQVMSPGEWGFAFVLADDTVGALFWRWGFSWRLE